MKTFVDGFETLSPLQANFNLNSQTFTNSFEAFRALLAESLLKPICLDGAAWTNTVVGTASLVAESTFTRTIRTGAASQSIISYIALDVLAFDLAQYRVDWDKNFSLFFAAFTTSDANTTRYVQLKEATGVGILANLGIGVVFANLAMTGEAYGTSRGTVSLATSLVASQWSVIEIRHKAGTGVEFFVNNVSKGSITTAGTYPSGNGAATANLAFTNDAGVGAASTDFIPGMVILLQEK